MIKFLRKELIESISFTMQGFVKTFNCVVDDYEERKKKVLKRLEALSKKLGI